MKTLSISENNVVSKPVGIWIRVSTEDQAAGDSPEHHRIRAEHYAAAKGWQVKETYDLAGVSGKSVIDHPECQRMMADIKRGHISGLIFSKLARFSRNVRELLDFAEFFKGHDADLISLQENIDTGTPSGRMFYNMVASMAQWEREEITDRIKASVAVRAKLGKPLSGQSIFGYHWKDKKLVPHPDEAPVRKLIYELYAQHGRKKAVAKILNERGYRTRDGSKFSDSSIERLIQNTTAKGLHRGNYTRQGCKGKSVVFKPEHEWVYTPVPAIISETLWQQCNDMLETRKLKWFKPGKRPVHLFAGLAVCTCGKKMYVPSNTPKYVCMACRNKIPIVDLEGIFMDELQNYLLSPDKVALYLQGAQSELTDKTRQLETLKKEMERVKAESDRTYALYHEGGMTVPQFKERYQPLDERKGQILAELPKLQAELDVLRVDGLTSEHIMNEVKDLTARWPKMALEEKRKIVELLVKDIRIGDGEITLNLCYLPTYEEMANTQRSVMALMPFCHLSITGKRPNLPFRWDISQPPVIEAVTFGDHIKRHRLKLRLFQYELAAYLGVQPCAIERWEGNHSKPHVRTLPAVIKWLGYDPRIT
jgi:site-specific DNA recombinase